MGQGDWHKDSTAGCARKGKRADAGSVLFAVIEKEVTSPVRSTSSLLCRAASPAPDLNPGAIRDLVKRVSHGLNARCVRRERVVAWGVPPKDGKIAVCYVDGEFTVKRLKITNEF